MSMYDEMEAAEQDICDSLNNGDIDTKQFNKEMRELQSDYRSMAEEASQDAYDNEMNNW